MNLGTSLACQCLGGMAGAELTLSVAASCDNIDNGFHKEQRSWSQLSCTIPYISYLISHPSLSPSTLCSRCENEGYKYMCVSTYIVSLLCELHKPFLYFL